MFFLRTIIKKVFILEQLFLFLIRANNFLYRNIKGVMIISYFVLLMTDVFI